MASDKILLDKIFTDRNASHETCIHWTTLGPDNGRPLIFIHGTPWSSFVWTAYARSLSSRFKVYLFDNPGYGVSPGRKPLGGDETELDVSLAGLAESFASLYRSWNFSSAQLPHVVAHDIGGIEHPLRVSNQAVFGQIPDAIHQGIVGAYIAGASFKPLPSHVAEILAAPWVAGGAQGQAGFIRQMVQAEERHVEEVDERYPEVGKAMPVKVIWGKEDSWIPVGHACRLGRAVNARETVIVDDAGHLIMFDQPERLATEIGIWLLGGLLQS